MYLPPLSLTAPRLKRKVEAITCSPNGSRTISTVLPYVGGGSRAPETSRLVAIDIPTGDAAPVAQKSYPIPYAYKEEVLKELCKLLESRLIEPSISAWARPILVRLKKDSKPDDVKLKIICDFKKLNQVTLPDSASLGDLRFQKGWTIT